MDLEERRGAGRCGTRRRGGRKSFVWDVIYAETLRKE